ncbi:MAG: GLPGLI family protein [Chryseobacterium sp.]|jgi:GLPGLI family protein|uniref:GLPGLI family protein n=1 Tax=Chryseobacterium sp. TaxID=1871047 RepID=UPI00283922B7|nr:GLPGLI family protein [Chryseobacterium sp.]MDR2234892.1 GLPGLI family protein [Chryseobacterium sp.]
MYKLLFLLSAAFFSAQNYRFVYEYKMKSDIKSDSLVTDYMSLDTDGKKSYFYNTAKYERDSAYAADKDFAKLFNRRNYNRNLNYLIEKDYAKKTISFYDQFKSVKLVTADSEIPQWKIEKEFVKINNMNCQKAVADYKGRNWEAWFSKDYPVNDGPYKFSGLPGLVVSVKDSEGQHIFNLIQIKKMKTLFDRVPENSKKMSENEYKKLMKNYTFIPSEDFEAFQADSKAGTVGVQLKDGYTVQYNVKELERFTGKGETIDDEILRRLKRTNNPIERD